MYVWVFWGFLFLLIYAKPLLPGMSAIKFKKKFNKIKKQKNNLIHHTFSRIPRKIDLKYDTCTQSIKATKQLPYHKVAQVVE